MMDIFVLKLILAPVIIGSASLAGRRWGPAVSGWLIGLPLTSGPVTFFVALSHSSAFAFDTVRGVLSGGFSLIAYSLAYAWIARKFDWRTSLSASLLVFAGMTMLLQYVTIPLIPLFALVVLAIFIGLWLLPKRKATNSDQPDPGRWDIPARILIGTSFILLITGIAPYIGSRLTGLLTTLPLYASILAVFAHRHEGEAGAVNVLYGLVLGLFAFAGFYLVLGALIENSHLAVSFGAATLAALVVQGGTLLVLQQLHRKMG